MKRWGRVLLALATSAAGTLVLASPASADILHVRPGQSIQAALNRAEPGDTVIVHPGIYRQNVEIRKNNIKLLGSGASPGGTVLLPPETPRRNRCRTLFGDPAFVAGICVTGRFDPETFEVLKPVVGARVKGFLVRGFSGTGILLLGANDTVVAHNQAVNNHDYGITAFFVSGGAFRYNSVHHNVEPGLYVGDSPQANFKVVGNTSYSNDGFGLFVRSASIGRISDNKFHDNCAGIVMLGHAPGPTRDWIVRNNQSHHNNRVCPGGDGAPPISGLGIGLAGTTHVVAGSNTVWGNKPSAETPLAGGIGVFSAGPRAAPVDNVVRFNIAYNNRPADLFWDRSGTGNRFVANQCDVGRPPRLCR